MLALVSFFLGEWYIYHPSEDLSKPALFWPNAKGEKPTADSPMALVGIRLDFSLSQSWILKKAFLRALYHWQVVPKAQVRMLYLGDVNFSSTWQNRLVEDGINAVELVKDWGFGSSIVALTVLHYHPSQGDIYEADVFLNGENYEFGDYELGIGSADLMNVLTHEFGHFLGLGHSQVRLATMSDSARPWEVRRRTLHQDDMDAIRWLYPLSQDSLPAPSLWRIEKGSCQLQWNYSTQPEVIDESTAQQNFCLYGDGFLNQSYTLTFISERSGSVCAQISASWISENLISFQLDLSLLAPDSYRLELSSSSGKKAFLRQALIVRASLNQLPVAEIFPESAVIWEGEEILLDGSSSYDPEGAPLSYRWFFIDADHPISINAAGKTITFCPDMAGDYLIGLMVDDGVNFSKISESLIEVKSKEEGQGCACQIQQSPYSAYSAFFPFILVVCFFLSLRIFASKRASRIDSTKKK